MRKILSLVVCILMISTCAAFAEGDNSSGWGFGNMPSMGGLSMPEMPSMSQEDWWGDFNSTQFGGGFSFDDFSMPKTGTWGDTGEGSSFSDFNSAFESFKNGTNEGMNGEWNFDFGDNSAAQEVFENQKNSTLNAGTTPSESMGDLFTATFGEGKKYSDLSAPQLPVTYNDMRDGMFGSLSMGTATGYDNIASIANMTRIGNIFSQASGTPDMSTGSLMSKITIGESADQHAYTYGDMNGTYNSWAGSMALKNEKSKDEFYGLYVNNKPSGAR